MEHPIIKVKVQTVSTRINNPVARIAVALFPIAMGGAIICAAAGIIPIKGHAPTLLLYSIGAIFALAGLSAILQEVKTGAAQVLAKILGFGIVCIMAVIFYWVFFNSPFGASPVFGVMKWFAAGFFGLIFLLAAIAKLWPGGPVTVRIRKAGPELPPPSLEITSHKRKRE
jgi:apolipoprotein N-acyltransferase